MDDTGIVPMTEVTVPDAVLVETKNVDSNGRIYVGESHAGERYQVVLANADSTMHTDKDTNAGQVGTESEGSGTIPTESDVTQEGDSDDE